MLSYLPVKKGIVIVTGLFCLTPWVGPPLALFLGLTVALSIGSVVDKGLVRTITSWLLKASVVGLGFGMNLYTSIEIGKEGLIFTVISITSVFGLGYYLAQKLSVDTKTSILISSGTAICGGSAIAAMAPIIGANRKHISIALGVVFILNSAALFLFPIAGDLMQLTQDQFGYWAAIAIHDTSSVVGAAASYGPTALSVATTVKLGRALWIIPLTFMASFLYQSENQKIRIPYFIIFFVGAMLLNTFISSISVFSNWIVPVAKQGLTFTLFLIGTGLSLKVVKGAGLRPLIKALLLWVFISIGSLWMILFI